MILSIALLLLLGIAYGFYVLVYRPKKQMAFYVKKLDELGYSVRVYPYYFLKSPPHEQFKQDDEKYGDRMYSIKHQNKHYDIGVYIALNKVIIELYNPDLLQEFLGPKNPQLYYKMNFLTANIKRVFGEGIAFSEGTEWKGKRKIMNSVFNYEFIKTNIPNIKRIFDENIQKIESEYFDKHTDAPKNAVKLDVLQLYSRMFSNVMLQGFFGIPSTYQKIEGESITVFMNRLNTDVLLQSYKPLSLLLGSKFSEYGLTQKDRDINRRIKILRAFARDKLDERLKQIDKNGARAQYSDIVEALVYTKQIKLGNGQSSGQKYDLNELIDEFCTFYTAGTDTGSHFIQMMIYYLVLNPKYQKKLREEINKYIKSEDDITNENLKKLTYIDWIQNQTTRMYGPGVGIMVRYAVKDHFIKDIPIKQNVGINISTLTNHYSQKYYQNPRQFNPERWENLKNLHPYALCGFSGGPRNCIGKHLAMLETKIGLIKFMRRYKEISLPKSSFKMIRKFIPQPEPMELTAVLDE